MRCIGVKQNENCCISRVSSIHIWLHTHIKKRKYTRIYSMCEYNEQNLWFEMGMCMFVGRCDAIILWIRWIFYTLRIWATVFYANHLKFKLLVWSWSVLFFYYAIKAYWFPYHLQTDTSRLTIGSRADMSNENIKHLTNSIRDEQDTSCHQSQHIRQMYKGMIAYISPLGNSWWLIFNKIEKSKRHAKS